MNEKGANACVGLLVLVMAVTSGVNLYLTWQLTSWMKAQAFAMVTTQNSRLDRIERAVQAVDADLDTHVGMADDIRALRAQVQALKGVKK